MHSDCIRFSKHSGAAISVDDQKSSYRHKNEYLEIKNRDPINILNKYIIEKKYLKTNELDEIKKNKISKISKKFDLIFKKILVRKI